MVGSGSLLGFWAVFNSVFKVGFPSGMLNSACGMSSAVSNLSVVDKYFKKEFGSWIKIPGHFQLFQLMDFSKRFGLVPYQGQGEGRIDNLSFTRGNGVKVFLTPVATDQYLSVDDAICVNL